jgi:NAD-dependent DNA ligase
MSDALFDTLEDMIRAESPNWSGLKSTGVSVKKTKVRLLVPQPSLDKVKGDDGTLDDYLETAPEAVQSFCISDKLDGTSLQLIYDKGVPVRLITRGDGVIGGDVSFMLPHLTIPQTIRFKKRLILRCEGIFTTQAFQKYKHEFDAARNAASGLMNRTSDKIHPATKDMRLVVLKTLDPRLSQVDGLALAKRLGFRVVPHIVVPKSRVTSDFMSRLLKKRTAESKYKMDGLVIEDNRINSKPTADRPDYAKAFKENESTDSAPRTRVLEIVWRVSQHGILVPKAKLKPVVFDGSTVQYATLNNAKWMLDRKIGPGAIVRLVRSGEIIPKIVRVDKPAERSAMQKALPSKTEYGRYVWDAQGTHLVLVNKEDSKDAVIRQNAAFFRKMGIDFVGEGTIVKLYDAGMTSIVKILRASKRDFLAVDGFQETSANKLWSSINTLFQGGVVLPQLLHASGAFDKGLGTRRFAAIQKKFKLMSLMQQSRNSIIDSVSSVPGFSTITATLFADGAPKFLRMFHRMGISVDDSAPRRVKQESNKLDGQSVTFTGFRDADAEKVIVKNGGEVIGFSSKTTVLLVAPGGKESSKPAKARSMGIPVMTWDAFVRRFKLKG